LRNTGPSAFTAQRPIGAEALENVIAEFAKPWPFFVWEKGTEALQKPYPKLTILNYGGCVRSTRSVKFGSFA
jgi:hypothetical protein